MRTVSFLGCTLAASAALGGTELGGGVGVVFSDIGLGEITGYAACVNGLVLFDELDCLGDELSGLACEVLAVGFDGHDTIPLGF